MNAGKKILITRPEGQSISWIRSLKELGFEPVSFPLIAIRPFCSHAIREAVGNISQYNWLLFTSANAVRAFMSWIHNNEIFQNLSDLPSIGVVGKATAAELVFYGYNASVIPDHFTAADLARALGNVEGQKILFPGSTLARHTLPDLLREKGAEVDVIPIYETSKLTTKKDELKVILSQGIDIVTFASPSTVEAFIEMNGPSHTHAVYACLGPVTADAARENGIEPTIIANPHTTDGLTSAILNYFSEEATKKETTKSA